MKIGPRVREVHFTFAVEQEGKPLFSAQHIWNVAAGTDEVKWKDKEGKDHHVTANLAAPALTMKEKRVMRAGLTIPIGWWRH